MRLIPRRVGPKLNLSLLLFMVLLAGAVSALVLFGFRRTQSDATKQSRQGLEAQGRDALLQFAQDQAYVGQSQLVTTGGAGQQAARYMVDLAHNGGGAAFDGAQLTTGAGGVTYDGNAARTSDVIVVPGAPQDAIERDLRDSATLDSLFPSLLNGVESSIREANFGATAIYFSSINGVTRSYPASGAAVSQHAAAAQACVPCQDDRFGPAKNPEHATVWTPPYLDPNGGAVITAYSPVYDGDQYRGVVGVDLSLARLVDQINKITPSTTGFAFYIDSTGNVLRTGSYDTVQAARDDTANTTFGRTLDAMRRGQTGVDRVTLGGRDVFVGYAPIGDVGGSFALVVPIDEVTLQAAAVTGAIHHEANRTLIFTLATLGLFFIAALAGSAWLYRRIILRPIAALVGGTQQLAAGDLNAHIPVMSSDELGMLADSFNRMTQQITQRSDALRDEVAERERTAQALRGSEELYRTLARNFPNGIVTIFDRDMRYTLADGGGLTSIGLTKETVEGKTTFELFPRAVGIALERRMRGALAGESSVFELPFGERTYEISSLPLLNDDREIIAGMGMTQDITDRKQAETQLREREEQYRGIFETTSDGLIITDLDGQIVEANPAACAMHGYTRDEFLALPRRAHVHPDYRLMREEYVDRIRAGGEFRMRARDIRKDGTSFPVDVLATLFAYRGEPHLLGVVRDITEQVEAEQVLEQRVEDRTRELSALLEVSRNVASTLELKPLLRALLEHLSGVVEYERSAFSLIEGDELHVVEVRAGHGAEPDDFLKSQVGVRIPASTPSLLWDIVRSRKPLIIPDVRDATSPVAAAYARMVGQRTIERVPVRSWMSVPLEVKGRVIGLLGLAHGNVNAFSGRDGQIIGAIANQAAIGIENARLFEQAENRTRELRTLLDVARHVGSTLELHPLALRILEEAGHVIGYDRAAFIVVEGFDGHVIDVRDANGPPDESLLRQVGQRFSMTVPSPIFAPLAAGAPVVIDDVRVDSPLSRAWAALGEPVDVAQSPVRAWAAVPLISQGKLVGILSMTKRTPAYFTPHHIELATAIASQAAVGVENARLFGQTERRTRELTTLLDVARHVASTLELRPLAQRILEATGIVVDYDRSTFMLAADGYLDTLAVRSADGNPDTSLLDQLGERHPIGGPPLIWDALLAGTPVIVDDTHAGSPLAAAYRQATGATHVSRSRARSWMAVPLITQGRLNGAILMSKRAVGFFTPHHAELVSAIASQAAIGVENARLFEQAEQRTRELETVLDVSHAVASTLDLRQLVSVILDELAVVTSYTGSSLLVREGDELVILDARGPGQAEDDVTGMRFPVSLPGGWWATVSGGESVIIDDVRGDSADARSYRRALGPYLESPAFRYVRSWLAVPLRHQDRVVGLLSMSRAEPGHFTEQHARLALAIADQAALAIENARLYERVQSTAALEERQRLARELHDSVSQALYGIGLGARTAKAVLERDPERAMEPINYVLSLAEAGLTEMRALIFELRPESLETEGLVAAIEKQVSATSARYGISVDAEMCDEPDAPLDVKEAVYRIAQEALHNTVKHAHATAAELRLTCDDGVMLLHVQDNGSGFDPEGDFPGHLGLKSMRERVTRVRGTLEIASAPGEGTQIDARIAYR